MWGPALYIGLLILQPIVYFYVDHKKVNRGRIKMFALFLLISILLPLILVKLGLLRYPDAVMCAPPIEFAAGFILVLMNIVIHLIYFVIDYLIKKLKSRSGK